MLLALVLLLAAAGVTGRAAAAFVAQTATGAGTWQASTLGPASGLTASRPNCGTAAAPTFVGKLTAAENGSADDRITLTRPGTWVAGDVLVALFATTATATNSSLTGPSGWTELYETVEGTYLRTAAYHYLLPASPPASFTFSWNYTGALKAEVNGGLTILAYRGADPAAPVATAAATSGNSASASAPVVTTTRPRSVRVFGASAMQADSMSTPAGMTLRNTQLMDENGFYVNDAYLGMWDETVTTAGATAARSTALNGGSHSWYGVSVVIQPPSDPTVALSWTAATDTRVTGYSVTRTGGGTTTVGVGGRTTVTYTDPAAPRAALGYALSSALSGSNWVSAAVTASVAACP